MYTLELDGRPFAIVNLPRHEAEDFFDEAMVDKFHRPRGLGQAATRVALHSEKVHLVRSFKQRYTCGDVGKHQFDGFFVYFGFDNEPGFASGSGSLVKEIARHRSLNSIVRLDRARRPVSEWNENA